MEKIIYIVRHCSAEGQSPHANLTAEGEEQTKKLAAFFDGIEIGRIITSPFKRARETAWPIAERKSLHVEVDSRLVERVLSLHDFEDALLRLKDTFLNLQLKYEGGESSSEAMERVVDVVDELGDNTRTVLVTHGNLMALLLKRYEEQFGFEEFQTLTNPDVYRVLITDDGAKVERIWHEF